MYRPRLRILGRLCFHRNRLDLQRRASRTAWCFFATILPSGINLEDPTPVPQCQCCMHIIRRCNLTTVSYLIRERVNYNSVLGLGTKLFFSCGVQFVRSSIAGPQIFAVLNVFRPESLTCYIKRLAAGGAISASCPAFTEHEVNAMPLSLQLPCF